MRSCCQRGIRQGRCGETQTFTGVERHLDMNRNTSYLDQQWCVDETSYYIGSISSSGQNPEFRLDLRNILDLVLEKEESTMRRCFVN